MKIALVRKLIFLDVRLLHVILRLGNISVSENLRLELLLLLVEILLIEIIRVGVGLKQVVMLLYESLLTCGWRKPEDLLHVHHLLLVIIERELLNLVKLLLLLLDLLLLYLNCLDLLGQRILSLNRLGGRGRRTWSRLLIFLDTFVDILLKFSALSVRQLLQVELEGLRVCTIWIDALFYYSVDAHKLLICQEVYVMTKGLSLCQSHLFYSLDVLLPGWVWWRSIVLMLILHPQRLLLHLFSVKEGSRVNGSYEDFSL